MHFFPNKKGENYTIVALMIKMDPTEFLSSVLSLQGTFLYNKTITGQVQGPSGICDFALFSVQ